MSLGSSGSLSRSQVSLSSPSKSVDILAVLTHILGQSVPRKGRTGEFVCGKCVSALERVFKFDTVIARVQVLSSERLQKLTQERDRIRQWVRQNYQQRQPQELRNRSSASEEDSEAEKEGYREMLKDNMALSEYECWSEKWDTCPYFIRTGKRCRKGKGCEGCDSLRVSDSNYESVCGIPRHMPFSPLELTRDKSRSMPLHWHGVPRSSPPSLTGSSLSLRPPSRTESVHSLDTLDGNDPFCSPGDQSVSFVLTELRSIEGKPLSSPSGSKIPVLGRKGGKNPGPTSPGVSRVLNFGVLENGGGQAEEEDGDVLTELRDEYMPLHREVRLHQLQGVAARCVGGFPGTVTDLSLFSWKLAFLYQYLKNISYFIILTKIIKILCHLDRLIQENLCDSRTAPAGFRVRSGTSEPNWTRPGPGSEPWRPS